MTAPAGTEVGLYVDLLARVEVGDVIETQTGRRYGVASVRVQARGKHAGRQHLRAVVLGDGEALYEGMEPDHPLIPRVHRIRWYRREARGAAVTSRRVLRAPFPWFGGKFNAAPLIWRAFGNVPNYVEPFAGSLATLLARPHEPKVETVNDKDGLIANFWRAVQHAPDAVAEYSDWPVNEADLHARHRWLVDQALPLTEKLISDPDWYDAKVAGWWVWGICAWIGGGWCRPDVRLQRRRPELACANGRGVNHPDRRRPHLSGAGMGVFKMHRNLPRVGSPGHGVHAPGMKKPLTHRNKGVHRDGAPPDLFEQLAARLRDVRVCCGDWMRVVGRSTLGIDTRHGMTPCAVLLDPPYAHELRDKRMYREDDEGLSAVVRAWAIENGSNPDLRIALCGFVDEHEMPSSWACHEWRSTSSGKSRTKERIWLSPHCLEVDPRQAVLPLEYSA